MSDTEATAVLISGCAASDLFFLASMTFPEASLKRLDNFVFKSSGIISPKRRFLLPKSKSLAILSIFNKLCNAPYSILLPIVSLRLLPTSIFSSMPFTKVKALSASLNTISVCVRRSPNSSNTGGRIIPSFSAIFLNTVPVSLSLPSLRILPLTFEISNPSFLKSSNVVPKILSKS